MLNWKKWVVSLIVLCVGLLCAALYLRNGTADQSRGVVFPNDLNSIDDEKVKAAVEYGCSHPTPENVDALIGHMDSMDVFSAYCLIGFELQRLGDAAEARMIVSLEANCRSRIDEAKVDGWQWTDRDRRLQVRFMSLPEASRIRQYLNSLAVPDRPPFVKYGTDISPEIRANTVRKVAELLRKSQPHEQATVDQGKGAGSHE